MPLSFLPNNSLLDFFIDSFIVHLLIMASAADSSPGQLTKYRDRAKSLPSLYSDPKRTFCNPWTTDAKEILGRCAVIEFEQDRPEGHIPTPFRLDNPEDLSTGLRNCLKRPNIIKGPPRRLVILEDLGKDPITFLGSYFRIPPEVFISHFNQPQEFMSPPLVDESGGPHDSQKYWRVGIPHLYDNPGTIPKDTECCDFKKVNLNRKLVTLLDENKSDDKLPGWLLVYHSISFWATETDDGGWTGMSIKENSAEPSANM